MKKIAALAESFHAAVVSHNGAGPSSPRRPSTSMSPSRTSSPRSTRSRTSGGPGPAAASGRRWFARRLPPRAEAPGLGVTLVGSRPARSRPPRPRVMGCGAPTARSRRPCDAFGGGPACVLGSGPGTSGCGRPGGQLPPARRSGTVRGVRGRLPERRRRDGTGAPVPAEGPVASPDAGADHGPRLRRLGARRRVTRVPARLRRPPGVAARAGTVPRCAVDHPGRQVDRRARPAGQPLLPLGVSRPRGRPRALASHPTVDPTRIGAVGTSQGGGYALALAALDARIRVVVADLPFLCGLRECAGIPGSLVHEVLQAAGLGASPDLATLDYFDAVRLAPWIQVPTLLTSGGHDRACPAETIAAVFDRLPGRRCCCTSPASTTRHLPSSTRQPGGRADWHLRRRRAPEAVVIVTFPKPAPDD